MQGSRKLRGYMPCLPTHPAQEAAPREAVAPEQQGREGVALMVALQTLEACLPVNSLPCPFNLGLHYL